MIGRSRHLRGFDHRKRRLAATSMVNGSFALVDHLIAAVDRRSWVLRQIGGGMTAMSVAGHERLRGCGPSA
jgi:hypothetical protein